MSHYKVGRLGGGFVVYIYDDAGRRTARFRLQSIRAGDAEREAITIFDTLTRPRSEHVGELWKAYVAEYRDRAVIGNMHYNWQALAPHFAKLHVSDISVEACRNYTTARRQAGIQDGTIATELSRLRMVLKWAEKRALIRRAPYIERPSPPRRKDHHLTRNECTRLIEAAVRPHIKVFIILALATGARDAALRGLTWDRVDFERRLVDLRDPKITTPHKGRAIVPINDQLLGALQEARERALSGVVVEWAGKPVGSVKKGLKATARAAGVEGQVSPHVFRHSAAVHMAEAGISMDEIAQFLGHEDVSVTRKTYARYSPEYLRKAASVLEYW